MKKLLKNAFLKLKLAILVYLENKAIKTVEKAEKKLKELKIKISVIVDELEDKLK